MEYIERNSLLFITTVTRYYLKHLFVCMLSERVLDELAKNLKKSFLQKYFVTRQYSSVSSTIVPFSNIKTEEEIHHKYLYKL